MNTAPKRNGKADNRPRVAQDVDLSETMRQAEIRRFEQGASDFFLWPVEDMDALTRSIERCVRQRQMRRDLQQSRQRLEAVPADEVVPGATPRERPAAAAGRLLANP